MPVPVAAAVVHAGQAAVATFPVVPDGRACTSRIDASGGLSWHVLSGLEDYSSATLVSLPPRLGLTRALIGSRVRYRSTAGLESFGRRYLGTYFASDGQRRRRR